MWLLLLPIVALTFVSPLQSDANECPSNFTNNTTASFDENSQGWKLSVRYESENAGTEFYNCTLLLEYKTPSMLTFEAFSETKNPEYCSDAQPSQCHLLLPLPECDHERDVATEIKIRIQTSNCTEQQCTVDSEELVVSDLINNYDCGSTKEFKVCGTLKTCRTISAKPYSGCFCKSDLLWDNITDMCVQQSESCPGITVCSKHWSGSHRVCRTCSAGPVQPAEVCINGSASASESRKIPVGTVVTISEAGNLTSLNFCCSLENGNLSQADIKWMVYGVSEPSMEYSNSTPGILRVKTKTLQKLFLCCKAENAVRKEVLCSEVINQSPTITNKLPRNPSFMNATGPKKSYNFEQSDHFVHVAFGDNVEVCIEKGEIMPMALFTCVSKPTVHPTDIECVIKNPEGVPSVYLSDGLNSKEFQSFSSGFLILRDALVSNESLSESLPVVLGRWTCVCRNNATKNSVIAKPVYVGPCYVAPKIDSGKRHLSFDSGIAEKDVNFKIGAVNAVIAGFSFTIRCMLLNAPRPVPSIRWFRNEEPLLKFTNKTDLTVRVNSSDPAAAAGDYRCTAGSVAGNDTANSNMRLSEEIFVAPQLPDSTENFTDVNGDVTITVGSTVSIQRGRHLKIDCSTVVPSIPPSNFRWTDSWPQKGPGLDRSDIYRPKLEGITYTESNKILNMDTILVNSYNLTYCCQVVNKAGEDWACSNVKIEGDYCTLECPEGLVLIRSGCNCSTTGTPMVVDNLQWPGIIAGVTAGLCSILIVFLIVAALIYAKWRKHKQLRARGFSLEMLDMSAALKNLLANDSKELAFTSEQWEMAHSDLDMQGLLGTGQFGEVKLALLKTASTTRRVKSYLDQKLAIGESLSTCRTVAVKYVKGISTFSTEMFLAEMSLMIKVSLKHNKHVVQFIGCILSEPPLAVVMEYVPFGSLQSNLVKWKEEAKGVFVDPTASSFDSNDHPSSNVYCDAHAKESRNTTKETLQTGDLFSFAHQIAKGMSYLSSLNVIHRDLACRNVLVGENKILKVADFGLSKEIDGVYTSTSSARLPIRWMPPEAIQHRIFSEKSDVWSFGICLWEMCTFGEVPYSHLTNTEVVNAVENSVLLSKPTSCHDDLYELMLKCWSKHPAERPTFKDIENYLEDIIETSCHQNYISLQGFFPEDAADEATEV